MAATDGIAAVLARAGLADGRVTETFKHHVGSRCTIGVDAGGARYVAKLFAEPATAAELLAVHAGLEEAGLASGRPPTTARVRGCDLVLGVVVTEWFAAPPATTLVECGQADRAGALAAQWLAAAASPGVTLGAPYGPLDALVDVDRYARTIAGAGGDLGARAGAVAAVLATRPPSPGRLDLRHGGFYLSHLFDLGAGPGIIDWDTYRQAPIEADAGMLCAMASRWAVHRPEHAASARHAVTVFLRDTERLIDGARLAWYRAASLLKFASYLVRRRPPDWERDVASLVREAAEHAP